MYVVLSKAVKAFKAYRNKSSYVIPAVVIMIGIAYILFGLFAIKQESKSKKENNDHYVTIEKEQTDEEPKKDNTEN